jgi:hypothetical protein
MLTVCRIEAHPKAVSFDRRGCSSKAAGLRNGLFAAFVAGCAMTVGLLGLDLLFE